MYKHLLRAAAMLSVVLICLLPISAGGRVSLYIDDSPYRDDSLLPFVETEGKQLVPLAAFGEFDTLTYTESASLGSALLADTSGAYLSISLHLGKSLDEAGEYRRIALYRYGGALYVEPTVICEKFGLVFETAYAADGYLCARLTDGSETISFSALLAAYDTGSDDETQLVAEKLAGRTMIGTFMHPIFLQPRAAAIPGIIRLLGKHSATFALDPAQLDAYIDVLPQIYAAGHTVAYYADASAWIDTEAFSETMNSANRTLFALLGKTTRLYVSTELASSMPDIDGYFKKACRMHLVADDLASERMTNMVLSESPGNGIFNFSLSTDADTRTLYSDFFKKFDTYTALRTMPMTEASATQ